MNSNAHAQQNADSFAGLIRDYYKAYCDLTKDEKEKSTADGQEFTTVDELFDRAIESAISLEVRGSWYTPGDYPVEEKPTEFRIMLTWGGPALRIVGDLDEGCPENARMQVQDWGTPWRDYTPKDAIYPDWEAALAWFVGCFYFGD